MVQLGFIGTGHVGGTLAKTLGRKGHSIHLGSRRPESQEIKELMAQIGSKASVGNISEVILKSDIIFLATPWKISEQLIKENAAELKNKIIIDCTNPLKADLSGLEVGFTTSGAEIIQQAAPASKVFKAFNTTGYNVMESPELESKKAVMYFCGDDNSSRHIIRELINEIGFDAIDGGPLQTARLLEPFALLWILSAYKFGLGRDFAFTLIKKK